MRGPAQSTRRTGKMSIITLDLGMQQAHDRTVLRSAALDAIINTPVCDCSTFICGPISFWGVSCKVVAVEDILHKHERALLCASDGKMSDDLFDGIHDLESKHIDAGHAQGLTDGLVAGLKEGRQLGVQKGYEIGVELGFYSGCAQTWRQLQCKDSSLIPAKAERGIAALEDLIAQYPLTDPQDERLHDALENIRGKFKAVASTLGHLSEYAPKEAPQGHGF